VAAVVASIHLLEVPEGPAEAEDLLAEVQDQVFRQCRPMQLNFMAMPEALVLAAEIEVPVVEVAPQVLELLHQEMLPVVEVLECL
jgi:hypothetical protein